MITKIWNEAKQNNFASKSDFPVAYSDQDKLLLVADKFRFDEIKNELITIITRAENQD